MAKTTKPAAKSTAPATKAPHPLEADRILQGRPPMPYTIGQRIAAARSAKGWTQAELAERLGKSRGTVVQYEQGNIEPPLKQVQRLADLLEVAPEMLAFGRQGITGLERAAAEVASVSEVQFVGPDELVKGVYGLPASLINDLALNPQRAKIVILKHGAPAFNLKAGDRVLIELSDSLGDEDRLYLIKTPRGADVVRLLPRLTDQGTLVNINDGSGVFHSVERSSLNVLGGVIATLQGG